MTRAFGGERAPTGWLLCDGAEVSRATYSDLFAAIGTAHGAGDGATTFQLPDYRGRFLRGVDSGAHRDPGAESREAAEQGGNEGDAIGSVQASATALPRAPFTVQGGGAHTHTLELRTIAVFAGDGGNRFGSDLSMGNFESSLAGEHTHALDGGDPETRPENAGVHFIIRH